LNAIETGGDPTSLFIDPLFVGLSMTLEEQIAKAFANVKRPDDDELTDCPCEECRENVRALRGKEWQALTDEDLFATSIIAQFNALSAYGFRYYLPAFLTHLLRVEGDTTASFWLLSTFTTSDEFGSLDPIVARLKILQPSHRKITVTVLESVIGKREEYCPAVLHSAIRNLTSKNATVYRQADVKSWLKEVLPNHPQD
jgi:hypothetical protein